MDDFLAVVVIGVDRQAASHEQDAERTHRRRLRGNRRRPSSPGSGNPTLLRHASPAPFGQPLRWSLDSPLKITNLAPACSATLSRSVADSSAVTPKRLPLVVRDDTEPGRSIREDLTTRL